MVVRHGEAFTISDRLTVWEDGKPIYRPTVHYAYLPTDVAISSLHELKMCGQVPQPSSVIMNDVIIDGRDELGVLLCGSRPDGLVDWLAARHPRDLGAGSAPERDHATGELLPCARRHLLQMIHNAARACATTPATCDVAEVAGHYLVSSQRAD